MFVIVKILAQHMSVSIANTIIQTIIGGIIYLTLLIILRYRFIYDVFNQVLTGIKAKIKRA